MNKEIFDGRKGVPSQYQRVVKSIGEKGHLSDLQIEFLPAVGGRIQSTKVCDSTSLHREYHFDGLGELNQVDIFSRVRKEEGDTNGEDAEGTAINLTLKRGNDRKFFIDLRAIRPNLLEKWYMEHPKAIPVPLAEQLPRRRFAILLKNSLFDIHETQKEFAKRIGVNEQTVSRWVRRETVPDRQNLEFMIDFFRWNKDSVLNAAFHKPEGFMLSGRRGRRKKTTVSNDSQAHDVQSTDAPRA